MGHSAYCSNQGTLPTPDRVEPENPKPFVWTKTAEDILERLASYCAAINTGA